MKATERMFYVTLVMLFLIFFTELFIKTATVLIIIVFIMLIFGFEFSSTKEDGGDQRDT